jgi:hypothetical protein
MSAGNYSDLAHPEEEGEAASSSQNQQPRQHRGPAGGGATASATEGALLGERDAVMLGALHTASLKWWVSGSAAAAAVASAATCAACRT